MTRHRTVLRTGDPEPRPSVVSISDMNVRAFKSLHIPGGAYTLGVAAAGAARVGGRLAY